MVAALEKNQNGPTGDVPFVFYKNYFMFRLADYLCEATPVEKAGKVVGWDNTGQFSRVHPDWRQLPEDEALTLAYRSIQGGARGLDMGRNIFQSEHSVEMAQAIRKIVHEAYTDKQAYEFYQELIH